jgi:hypothetical protein
MAEPVEAKRYREPWVSKGYIEVSPAFGQGNLKKVQMGVIKAMERNRSIAHRLLYIRRDRSAMILSAYQPQAMLCRDVSRNHAHQLGRRIV